MQAKAAVPTKDGDAYWSIEKRLGEETFDYNASVYKLQYVNGTGTEEWHGNGVLRFADKAGNTLLALTHRFYEEAFVVKDPWTYAKADGADAILQRFGTPPGPWGAAPRGLGNQPSRASSSASIVSAGAVPAAATRVSPRSLVHR